MPRYYYPGARDTTNGARKLSVFWLRKRKIIEDNCWSRENVYWYMDTKENKTGDITIIIDTRHSEPCPYIEFSYKTKPSSSQEWKVIKYRFDLVKARCNFGGFRWYFRCGLSKNDVYCGRRVAILYQAGSYFGCRHCASLSYDSCNTSSKFRGGIFGFIDREWKAEEYYKTLKRRFYKGKPTRKYKRYLKMDNLVGQQVFWLEKDMHKLIKRT